MRKETAAQNGCGRLEAALSVLAPGARAVMELFLEGHSLRQIARLVGRDEGVVESELRSLVARLQIELVQ